MLSCQEVQKRFDVFLDGETDGRTMRDLALHVAQCAACEGELRGYERLHVAFTGFLGREVDRIDVAALWTRIEAGLGAPPRRSWRESVGEWWQSRTGVPWVAPALAAAASFAAVVTVASLRATSGGEVPAVASNEAHIEQLDASASHVAVWSEPVESTTAIWFASHEP
jgi:hypothetical protein